MTMQIPEHERFMKLGENYWWLEGKYRLVESYLKHFAPPAGYSVILESGCGPGNFLTRLKRYGKVVVGMEIIFEPLRKAESLGHRVLNADASSYPLRDGSVDLIVMVDVLEHIKDEKKALSEAKRILRPGGHLLLSVPAFQSLWGAHDEIYGHHRRYRTQELFKKVQNSGFSVIKNSYVEPLFFLPVWLVRRLKGRKREDDFYPLPRWLNWLLTQLFTIEAVMLRWFNFPFGVALICIARAGKKLAHEAADSETRVSEAEFAVK